MIEAQENRARPRIGAAAAPARLSAGPVKADPAPLRPARYSEGMETADFSRLVVLVPDRDVDEAAFARKIWSLLGRRRVSILFVTLVSNSDYGPGAQRRLATLAAITRDVFYQIETRVVYRQSWIKALAGILQPGDLVACHAAQRSGSFPNKGAPLADLILTRASAPVYVFTGLYPEPIQPRPTRILRQIAFWGILAGIIAGSFVFEADIDHLATGWINSLLFIFVFVVEILFIWLWNFLRI